MTSWIWTFGGQVLFRPKLPTWNAYILGTDALEFFDEVQDAKMGIGKTSLISREHIDLIFRDCVPSLRLMDRPTWELTQGCDQVGSGIRTPALLGHCLVIGIRLGPMPFLARVPWNWRISTLFRGRRCTYYYPPPPPPTTRNTPLATLHITHPSIH